MLALGVLVPTKWSTHLEACAEAVPLYVVSDAFHSNFMLPVQNEVYDWRSSPLWQTPLKGAVNRSSYLLIGWGDRDFYMHWEDGKARNAWSIFKAAFLPTPTVMHVGVFSTPLKASERIDVKRVWIAPKKYQNLVNFIEDSFQQDSQGNWNYLGKGLDQDSAFFAGVGSYSILYTCNNWTAKGLRIADINSPLWAGLAPPLMFQLPQNPCGNTEQSRA